MLTKKSMILMSESSLLLGIGPLGHHDEHTTQHITQWPAKKASQASADQGSSMIFGVRTAQDPYAPVATASPLPQPEDCA